MHGEWINHAKFVNYSQNISESFCIQKTFDFFFSMSADNTSKLPLIQIVHVNKRNLGGTIKSIICRDT